MGELTVMEGVHVFKYSGRLSFASWQSCCDIDCSYKRSPSVKLLKQTHWFLKILIAIPLSTHIPISCNSLLQCQTVRTQYSKACIVLYGWFLVLFIPHRMQMLQKWARSRLCAISIVPAYVSCTASKNCLLHVCQKPRLPYQTSYWMGFFCFLVEENIGRACHYHRR